jgi:nucleolar protein 56
MQKKDFEQMRKKLIQKAKKEIAIAYGDKEIHAVKAVSVCEDIDTVFNLLSEHVREWYGTHFPELDNLTKEPFTYLKLVHALGNRKNFSEKSVGEIVEDKGEAKKIIEAARKSMGAEIENKRLDEIKLLALNALNLKEERIFLEKFLETETKAIAPNFSEIAGSMITAKFLKQAGSLKALALMPSSTIQLLGAEKALFRHLKSKKKIRGPKYGFLYAHALVRQLPLKKKGRMARAIAGKLCIAAKADFFTKRNIAAELQKELNARFEGLKKAN